MDLKELERQTSNLKKRANRLYHLARSLGFTAHESQVLSNQSEDTIRRLAQEKQAGKQ